MFDEDEFLNGETMETDSELNEAVKEVLEDKQATMEEQVNRRADQIVKEAFLGYMALSGNGIQACKMVEAIMQNCVRNMALVMPDDWRTGRALECLEEASMWAKKAISVFDTKMSMKDKETNGTNNRDS